MQFPRDDIIRYTRQVMAYRKLILLIMGRAWCSSAASGHRVRSSLACATTGCGNARSRPRSSMAGTAIVHLHTALNGGSGWISTIVKIGARHL